MIKNIKKVLGFRSGNILKIIIATIWYLMSFILLFYVIYTVPPVKANVYDVRIYKLSGLILYIWMLSPAIFLSNTCFRNHMPLFRSYSPTSSLMGMMIVFLFFAYLFASVESLHSPEYQKVFNSYIESAYQQFVDVGRNMSY